MPGRTPGRLAPSVDSTTSRFPLMVWGMDLAACIHTIKSAGLPVPPKSSCYFCPSMKPQEVRELSPLERGLIILQELSAEPYNTKIHGLWRRPRKTFWTPRLDHRVHSSGGAGVRPVDGHLLPSSSEPPGAASRASATRSVLIPRIGRASCGCPSSFVKGGIASPRSCSVPMQGSPERTETYTSSTACSRFWRARRRHRWRRTQQRNSGSAGDRRGRSPSSRCSRAFSMRRSTQPCVRRDGEEARRSAGVCHRSHSTALLLFRHYNLSTINILGLTILRCVTPTLDLATTYKCQWP
jgi:hypothetical protein